MSTEIDGMTFTEMVGDIEIPCDWNYLPCHRGAPARWVVSLRACKCGRTGVRLACSDCKSYTIATDAAAECGACGEMTIPFRAAFRYIEPLDRKARR